MTISLEGVWKSYLMPDGSRHQIYSDLWLKLPPKTNVGIVGRNGAGKSTLMRLMSGADHPDRGRVRVEGRVSPPIGLTGGVSPWLSGRENAKFVCRIRGDDLALMRERLAFIHEFSELGAFFEHPIKTYSTGMRARLTFAISMAFDYDYYLMDEITSTGDEKFRRRADAAIRIKRDRASIVLVSHSMETLRLWCQVGLYVKRGTIQYFDNISHAIEAYLRDNS
ncbi:MAG: ABC transporter ATP-binding protein [Panacagrimonas sp.]